MSEARAFGRGAVMRAVLLMTGSAFTTYAIGLVVSTLIARRLGPTEFGQYSYLIWLSGILGMFYNNGLTLSGLRFVSEANGRGNFQEACNAHGWLRRRFFLSLIVVSIGFLLCYKWVAPSGWEGSYLFFTSMVLVSAIGKSGYLFEVSVVKGHGLFNVEAHTTSLLAVITLIGVLVLLYMDAGLAGYVIWFVAVSVGHWLLTWFFVRRTSVRATHGEIDPERLGKMRRHLAWSALLMLVMALSNRSFETFLLNARVGPEAVGFFAIGAAMTRAGIDLLAAGLTSILMPMMSHALGAGGQERVKEMTSDAIRYFFFLGLLAAGVGALWSGPGINLMYGSEYQPAILAMRVMVIVGGIWMIEAALSSLLATTDQHRARLVFAAVSILTAGVAAFVLIPRYGFEGALAAHALSKLLTLVVILGWLTRRLRMPIPYRSMMRMAFAGALALVPPALLLWLVSDGLVAQAVAGVLFAIGLLLASVWVRVWTPKDLSVVRMASARFSFLARLALWLEGRARPS